LLRINFGIEGRRCLLRWPQPEHSDSNAEYLNLNMTSPVAGVKATSRRNAGERARTSKGAGAAAVASPKGKQPTG